MAKKSDFPHDLRHFADVLNSFRGHFYDYDIFRDFVDYAAASLLWNGDPKLADDLKNRYQADYTRLNDMFVALVNTMAEHTSDGGWYDALGSLYQVIASRNKCSWLGQFFTPPAVCDLMAQMQAGDVADDATTANDPACGSGRTLLALNAIRPGLYIIAQDLDPICTRMAAINMALHGIKGQALNGNSLKPDDFSFGYEINPRLYTLGGIPHTLPITREQSYAWQMWQSHLKAISAAKTDPKAITPKNIIKTPAGDPKPPKNDNLAGLPATQMTIF